jgi:hypothetical protein
VLVKDSKQTMPTVREKMIAAALSGPLLPDLTRIVVVVVFYLLFTSGSSANRGIASEHSLLIVCDYQRRPGHRFDPATAPVVVAVSVDGRSFRSQTFDDTSLVVWSCYTLFAGAQRWSIRIPADQQDCCWIGVADVRTRGRLQIGDIPDCVRVGGWNSKHVYSIDELGPEPFIVDCDKNSHFRAVPVAADCRAVRVR